MQDIVVVKVGGSSATSPDLWRWVSAIEQASRPIVVVPGGGPFAHTVRRYQARIGFDDKAAHEMAILAMEQFGCALQSLGKRMVKAASEAEITAAFEAGRIPVWMPLDLVLADASIDRNWTVTSDSLAAWLANRLKGSTLCLVKQIDLPDEPSVDQLVGARVVDESFSRFLKADTPLLVAGPGDLSSAALVFAEGGIPGRSIAHGARRKSEAETAAA